MQAAVGAVCVCACVVTFVGAAVLAAADVAVCDVVRGIAIGIVPNFEPAGGMITCLGAIAAVGVPCTAIGRAPTQPGLPGRPCEGL